MMKRRIVSGFTELLPSHFDLDDSSAERGVARERLQSYEMDHRRRQIRVSTISLHTDLVSDAHLI